MSEVFIKCPGCGYEMANSNTRCPKCGKEFKNMSKTCPKCGSSQKDIAKFCSSCGADISKVVVEDAPIVLKDMYCEKCKVMVKGLEKDKCATCGTKLVEAPTITNAKEGKKFDLNGFGPGLYLQDEDRYLAYAIGEELKKDTTSGSKTLSSIERRKTIMSLIYGLLVFLIILIYIFYHLAFAFCTVLVIILSIIYFKLISKYNLKSYILKEVKTRPDEKISNITASILSSASTNKIPFIVIRVLVVGLFLVLPVFLFSEPHLIYEKDGEGYVLRYYTLGILKQDKELTIPSKYKGYNVTGIRGDVFRNVKSLEKVVLPDTLKEIRGGAFKNCKNLVSINIPESVESIGGEAFKNCSKLNDIVLPEKLSEIRGNTFEECTSLEKINIPDSVTRIGGHAFYGCSSLSEVVISRDSQLTEIGSSAFRRCSRLTSITIPSSVSVNSRAFKESPTRIEYFGSDISSIVSNYTKSDVVTLRENEEYEFVVNGNNNKLILYYIFAYSDSYSFRLYDEKYVNYPMYVGLDRKMGYKEVSNNLLIAYEDYNEDENSLTIKIYYN